MFDSFRGFIEFLEKKGGLVRKRDPVNPHLEINRIAKASIEKGGPAILFERVKGHRLPIVAGVFGTRERIFDVLGTSEKTFCRVFNERLGQIGGFSPRTVTSGPVKENRVSGKSLDINRLPFTMHGEMDGGWYLSSGVCVSRDPASAVRNASFHRLKRHGERTMGLWMAPFDLHRIVHAYWVQEKPCPIAIVIGADPYTLLAACTSIPYHLDEFAFAGALKEESLDLVSCESVPLEVPATAEIVLEGWVKPNDLLQEGPFAETSGYYSSPKMAPVITLTSMTHRDGPLFHDIVTGIPPDENQAMLVTHEAQANRLATDMFPESVAEVYLTPGGCTSFNAVTRIRKRHPGEAKQIGIHLLTVMPRLKNVWMVDEALDAHNPVQVEWAHATRCRGERDMVILRDMRGVPLDPCAIEGMVDKVVFDCTTPLSEEMVPGEMKRTPCT